MSRIAIRAVYTKTSEDSPLRRLIVDIFLFLRVSKGKTRRPPHRSYQTAGWHDFCGDVDMESKMERAGTKVPWDEDYCEYHCHPDQPEGCICEI
jgi:hypothetical protein